MFSTKNHFFRDLLVLPPITQIYTNYMVNKLFVKICEIRGLFFILALGVLEKNSSTK